MHCVDDRIITLTFDCTKNKKLKVIGAYLPSSNKDEYERCLSILTSIIKNCTHDSEIIIIGDFNADPRRSYKYSKNMDYVFQRKYNRLDIELMEWLREQKLKIVSELYTQLVDYTFLNISGHHSNIDLVITQEEPISCLSQVNVILSNEERKEILNGNRLTWDDLNWSDHIAISIDLDIKWNTTLETKTDQKRQPKLNWDLKKHKLTYTKAMENSIKTMGLIDMLENMTEPSTDKDKLDQLELVGSLIDKCMTQSELMAIKELGLDKPREWFQKSKPWFNEVLKLLVERRKRARLLYILTGYDIFRQILAKIRSDFRKEKKKSTKILQGKFIKKVNKTYHANRNFFWRELNKKKSKIQSVDIEENTLISHFKKLFSSETTNDVSTREWDKLELEKLEKEIERVKRGKETYFVSVSQISQIMHKLPRNKSAGPKKFRNELFKYASETNLALVISYYLEKIINFKVMPSDMNVGLIVPIIKDVKGSYSDVDNIRPITLSDVMAIIFESYVLITLNKRLYLEPQQFGFRQNSSTCHAIYTIKYVMRKLKENKKKGYAVFLDYSKAFDKVKRVSMLNKLIGELPENIWLSLHNYYDISTVHVMVHKENRQSEKFRITGGVKQGGNLSPVLFNKYIDGLIKNLINSNKVIEINNIKIGVIVYADDTVILCDSIENTKESIALIESYCLQYGITINAKKTNWMRLNETAVKMEGKEIPRTPLQDENFSIGGTPLDKVSSFRYLGVWIQSNNCNLLHIKKRKQAGYAALETCENLGIKEDSLDLDVKGTLISTYIRPRIMYGFEAISPCSNNETALIKMEGNLIKKLLKLKTRSYSEPVYNALGIPSLTTSIEKRRLSFIKQLISNELTEKIIKDDIFLSLLIDSLIAKGTTNGLFKQEDCYESKIKKACSWEITRLAKIDSQEKQSDLNKTVKYLLKYRNEDNDKYLEYILCPRNEIR
jgi:hypothetical protein